MTRRETLVAVLRGTNSYSLSELNAMNAIVGDFLTVAEDKGVTHTALADRLVAFKQNGGSGLANAIREITEEFEAPPVPSAEQRLDSLVAAIRAALDSV
jgi:hypothetical protein